MLCPPGILPPVPPVACLCQFSLRTEERDTCKWSFTSIFTTPLFQNLSQMLYSFVGKWKRIGPVYTNTAMLHWQVCSVTILSFHPRSNTELGSMGRLEAGNSLIMAALFVSFLNRNCFSFSLSCGSTSHTTRVSDFIQTC